MDNNEITKALGQVPELVKAIKTLIEDNARKDGIITKALQVRPQAEIPQSEIEKVAHGVAKTPCALPDTQEIAKAIAVPVMDALRRSLAGELEQTIKKVVQSIPIEILHTHTTLAEMTRMAEKKLRRSVFVSLGSCIITLIIGVILFLCVLNSKEYLGVEYRRILKSEYITEAEYEMLKSESQALSLLPKESVENKKYCKRMIRRNKQILRQRKAEAKANDGDYSTSMPLER